MSHKDEAVKAAQDFMKYCNANVSGSTVDAFAAVIVTDHRTLQQNAFRTMLTCIESWARDDYGHDARNEQTHEICKRFIAAFDADPEQLHLPYI